MMIISPPRLSGLLLIAALLFGPTPAARADDFMAGLALEYRPDGQPDHPGAARLYEAAARAGSRPALKRLFQLYGPAGPLWAGPETWRPWLAAAAESGWPEAQFELGRALEQEMFPAEDGRTAEDWYRPAAQSGYGPAALSLGRRRLAANPAEGALWLALAAAGDTPGAALELGRLYAESRPELAEHWLSRDQAPEARFFLGQLFLKQGRPVEAHTVLSQAAQRNYPEANLALGLMALESRLGRRPNPREAFRNFKTAAAAGLPEAAYQLAAMYLAGQATPKDPITAAYWFHQAGAAGLAKGGQAFNDLAQTFTKGQKNRLERMIAEGAPPHTVRP